MLASYTWLVELSGVEATPEEMADRLTSAGLEVEAMVHKGQGLGSVVVAEVRSKKGHPKRDALTVVTVFDGEAEYDVVCGASNVPQEGGQVVLAKVGSKIGQLDIAERKMGGVLSRGMLCSEVELDIGVDGEGIVVLSHAADLAVGTPIVDALRLQDTIFEIGITPNRPDALGHIGLAREVALAFGRTFEGPAFVADNSVKSVKERPSVGVTIKDADRCPRYGAALVCGVSVGPSPFAVRYRLHNLGLRPVSNVVDATNLILLEYGHPIHAFDLNKVGGAEIVVRLANKSESMTTLDGQERQFTDDDLLICDAEGPVAVAGVMGGADSEIEDTTTDVLIECAYFDPRSVRRTSRRLALHTDASHRFERGVDPNGVPRVLAAAAATISSLAGGTAIVDVADVVAQPITPRPIVLRKQQIKLLLGTDIPDETTRRVLVGVGCEIQKESAETFEVTVPTWRPDLQREADLIEEVARVYGYDNIPTSVPRVRAGRGGDSLFSTMRTTLGSLASANGFYEAISYSFVAPKDLLNARVSTDAVVMANPLSEDRSVMRTSLLVGLAHSASSALRRQVDEVRLFELGKSFHPSDAALPIERRKLGLILAGISSAWIGKSRRHDFYDIKGAVESVLSPLVGELDFAADDSLESSAKFLHPKRRASVAAGDRVLGVMGELHPDVVDALALQGVTAYAEIDLEAVAESVSGRPATQAQALPRFPAMSRDLAMVVAEQFSAGAIAKALSEAADGLAESVTLFDLYQGGQIPAGQRSLAFRIVYRDPEATLTDKRVQAVHTKVLKAAQAQFKSTIR